jgi:hypothetical protein
MSCLQSCFTNSDFNKKLAWSAVSAAIFVAVSMPQTYAYTSNYANTSVKACPTGEGKLIHAGVFFVLNYLAMKLAASRKWNGMDTHSDKVLAKYSAYGTLLFLIVASSDMYAITESVLSGSIESAGCPTQKGVFVHGVVFMVVVVLLMYLPRGQ